MAKTTEEKLSALGYTMEEANEYVHAMVNMGQAQGLADRVSQLGINAQDLANIVDVQKQEVIDYFKYSSVDINLLNAEKTGHSLVIDDAGGVYLYDPLTARNKKVVDFHTSGITDVAADANGDIYAITADRLFKYDFSEEKIYGLGFSKASGNALGFFGDALVSANLTSQNVKLADNSGQVFATFNLPFAGSGQSSVANADLVVVGDKLYRNAPNGLTETDVNTGAYRLVTPIINGNYGGLADMGEGWIIGYSGGHLATGVNVNTGELKEFPVFGENPLSGDPGFGAGATEARQMHVDLWGLPA